MCDFVWLNLASVVSRGAAPKLTVYASQAFCDFFFFLNMEARNNGNQPRGKSGMLCVSLRCAQLFPCLKSLAPSIRVSSSSFGWADLKALVSL